MKWTKPRGDSEYDEVETQGINHLRDKQKYKNAVRTGKVKTIPSYKWKDVENTDAAERSAKAFKSLHPAKQQRVLKAFGKGKSEMPITVGKHLLAGNTRATRAALLNKPTKVLDIKEDAPVNNVGGGNIAGAGVGPDGEPGISKKRQRSWQKANAEGQGMLRRKLPQFRKLAAPQLEEGRFAGHKTFKVPTSVIVNTKHAKRKHGHWSKFLPENNIGIAVREWANANPSLPVILEDDIGNIVFVRYGNNK